MKVVVVGGGWAGCGAAYCAEKNGAEVVLLERADSLYDIARTPVAITDYLLKQGVEIHLQERVTKVQKDGDRLLAAETACGNVYEGDVFIDATGTAGPMNTLPRQTAIGEAISYVNEMMKTQEGIGRKYTFSGSVFFERMKELNLYTTDISAIRRRINNLGLRNIFGT